MEPFPKLTQVPLNVEALLAIVSRILQAADGKAPDNMNSVSRSYRKKASEFAELARREVNVENMHELVRHALSWIQLAENEEMLHEERRLAGNVPPEDGAETVQ